VTSVNAHDLEPLLSNEVFSVCHRSLQNAPPVITSKCTTSDGCFLLG
jgi:hypothetical protein